ncbi:MAG: iron-sulfur cluster assembly accessory protein, partial [Candidatus Poseidoniales archaeon]
IVQITLLLQRLMGLLDGSGFSLPVVTDVDVVEVKIDVTESAQIAMEKSMKGDEKTHVLIISAEAGGCSGYLYDMKITENPDDDNFQKIKVGDISILIHNKDSSLLNGIKLDYKDTLMGGGFQIENPSADRECGCGQSFG